MSEKGTGKPLQARVDAVTAKKFEAVRRALNMTDSQLLRRAIDIMLKQELEALDQREAEMLQSIKEIREILES